MGQLDAGRVSCHLRLLTALTEPGVELTKFGSGAHTVDQCILHIMHHFKPQVVLVKSLLCARDSVKGTECLSSVSCHNSPVVEALLQSPISQMRKLRLQDIN